MKVRVYWNLHKKCFSVQSCKTGRVVGHANNVNIADAKFVVRKAGQAKVRREGKKNVHAFVVGYISNDHVDPISDEWSLSQRVTYNPYMNDTFVFANTQEPVLESKVATLGIWQGKPSIWA